MHTAGCFTMAAPFRTTSAHSPAAREPDDMRAFPLLKALLVSTLLSLLLQACFPAAERGGSPVADIVLTGGKVITVDPDDRITQAVAVRGNRIAAVGSESEITRWIGPETQVLNLAGRTVVPGFIDAHNHVEHTAYFLHLRLNIHSPPLASSSAVLEKVVRQAAKIPAGTWIVGQGTYGQPMPSREELDRAVPDHPVVLRWSMHRQVANSSALEASGIDRDTSNPPGGRIERGPDGSPTGILLEAFDVLKIPPYPYDEVREAIRRTLADIFLKQGVTSVYALPASGEAVRAFQDLWLNHELPVRVHLNFTAAPGHQPLSDVASLLKLGIHTGWGDDWLKVGAIKIFVDGDAAMSVNYGSQPEAEGDAGLPRPPEQLTREVTAAHSAGWQLWLHAIGDRAQDIALDAFEAALETHPRKDHRHRIEHMGIALSGGKALARARRLGVIPVPTIAFLWADSSVPAGETWYPLATLLRMGFQPPGNADSAGTQTFSINPMFSIERAVTRKGRTGESISPEEAISPMDVIRMHTIYAARAGFEEKTRGSLEPGKLADLVVLSGDPLTAPADEIMKIRADMTMIDGEIRYQRSGVEL
ncbi:MAG: amidohydrolase [Acidobacteriota bacterium]